MARHWLLIVLCLLSLGCAAKEEPPPPTAPMPEDLSHFTQPVPVLPPPPEVQILPPPDRPQAPNELLYPYEESREYYVEVGIGWPLDVILEKGEDVRNVADGDKTPLAEGEPRRWEVQIAGEGMGATSRPHLFIAATHAGQRLGLIVTTTRRTYYLAVKSVAQSPHRAVRWTYPSLPQSPPKPQPPGLYPRNDQPHQLHVGYMLEPSDPAPDWLPQHVVDDGAKVYILFSPTSRYEEVPMIRMVGPNGPAVVNARQHRTVMIVDQLFQRAELRLGVGPHAETVRITRGPLRTITCPGAPECPQWPPPVHFLQKTPPPMSQAH